MTPETQGGRWTAEITDELLRNPWFGVLEQDVTLPDGSRTTYFTLDFPSPAVGVIPRDGDRYLLIRQYRFIVDAYVWAIPSGGVHPGESLAEAASRELVEETGFAAASVSHLLSYFPSYGCSNQRFELFLGEGLSRAAGEFDRNEVIESKWFHRSEVIAMILDNQIVDGLSLTPLAVLLLREELQRAGGHRGERADAAR